MVKLAHCIEHWLTILRQLSVVACILLCIRTFEYDSTIIYVAKYIIQRLLICQVIATLNNSPSGDGRKVCRILWVIENGGERTDLGPIYQQKINQIKERMINYNHGFLLDLITDQNEISTYRQNKNTDSETDSNATIDANTYTDTYGYKKHTLSGLLPS